MNKYKTDIAASASSMMELPGTLEGMLHDIHGQVEVTPATAPPVATPTSPTEPKKKKNLRLQQRLLNILQ